MTIPERLKVASDSLGSTPDEVAERLVRDGIKGIPSVCRKCPIAEWLTRQGFFAVSVSSVEISVHDPQDYKLFRVETPTPVVGFILAFDCKFNDNDQVLTNLKNDLEDAGHGLADFDSWSPEREANFKAILA